MKNIICNILILCFVSTHLLAQNPVTADSLIYETAEEDAYGLNDEVSQLFKLPGLAIETKVANNYSLSLRFFPSTLLGSSFHMLETTSIGYNFEIEARYYYQMKKRVEAGKQMSNLSGHYISFAPSVGFSLGSGVVTDTSLGFSLGSGAGTDTLNNLQGRIYRSTLSLGKQNRIGSAFYWDRGVSFSYANFLDKPGVDDFSAFTLSRKSNFGIYIKRGKKNQPKQTKMKVHLNEQYSLRAAYNNISLSRIKQLNNTDIYWRFELEPHVFSELKIANSSFSLINDFRTRIQFSNRADGVESNFRAERILFSLKMGARFYYKMKKNMLSGKGGNNFNGGYFVSAVAYNNTIDADNNLVFLSGGWGYQLEMGKRFFINPEFTLPLRIRGTKPVSNVRQSNHLDGAVIALFIGRKLF